MIVLTDSAVQKVEDLLSEDEVSGMLFGTAVPRALRVGVRSGGCSGFSYDLRFSEEEPGDQVAYFGGVRVVMDVESARLLESAVLDYKEGLQGAGFVFDNPGASRSCGCGQSFS